MRDQKSASQTYHGEHGDGVVGGRRGDEGANGRR